MKQILLILIVFILFSSHCYCALGTKIRIIPIQGTVLIGFDKDNKLDDDSKIDEWDQLDWTEIVEKKTCTRRTYIDTGDDGYAKVQFYKSRSLIRVLPDTKLFIEQNNIYVYSGKSFYKIEKKTGGELVVRTPTAIAGIRGTIFEVGVDNYGDKSDFSVYEGMIEVASEKDKITHNLNENKQLSVFDGAFKGPARKFEGKKRFTKFWGNKSWKQKFEDRLKKIEILKKFKKFNLLKPGQANSLFKNIKPEKIREMLSNNRLMKFVKSKKFQGGIKKWKDGMKTWRKNMRKASVARKKRRKTWWKTFQKNMKNNKKLFDKWKKNRKGTGTWFNNLKNNFQKAKTAKKKNILKKDQVKKTGANKKKVQNAWQNWIQNLKKKP